MNEIRDTSAGPGSAGVPPASPHPEVLNEPSVSAGRWRSRGYLPHFDQPGLVQSITFRLRDSVPEDLIEGWKLELSLGDATLPADDPRMVELRERTARYEDAGHGECHLRDPGIAKLVQNALLHFDGERYRLLAWCVMPNHVHVLVETKEHWLLETVLHSWKSFTAKKANKILRRKGKFWMREYHDRYIRDEKHLRATRCYIEENPVKARLVKSVADWRWSSAGVGNDSAPLGRTGDADGTPALPAHDAASGGGLKSRVSCVRMF